MTDEIFWAELKIRESQDDISAIDFLYNYIDDLIDSHHPLVINNLILDFIASDFDLRLSVAFLTITAPNSIKSQLSNRSKLLAHAKQKAIDKKLSTEQIEAILDGF